MPRIQGGSARVVFFLPLVFICTAAFSQDWLRDAYMVPPKVYMGDRASLVLPLPGYSGVGDIDIASSRLPSSPELDIHRVAFERRPGGSRLVVEFSAYAPGILEMPPLEIAGEIFYGLSVEISSILESDASGRTLSAPALPLAVPGTSFLVYGTIGIVLLVLLLVVWVLFGEHLWLNTQLAVWKRRRLLVSMLRIEKRLRKNLIKGGEQREILDMLSGEFRSFISWLSGKDCRAMTATEIGGLTPSEDPVIDYAFLGKFFNRCDDMRFNGQNISQTEALAMLDNVKYFLTRSTPA